MDASSTYQDSLPIHPDSLIARLTALNLPFESHTHPPLRTVADSKEHRAGFLTKEDGGAHIKNLYLRDRKKNNFLAVIEEDKDVDLKKLSDQLAQGVYRLAVLIDCSNFVVCARGLLPLWRCYMVMKNK